MSGRVQVNAQQQTQLQQSVLSSRNVDRVRVNTNSLNFRVNAGVVVPRNISVVSVSAYPALIDVYPDYRDDSFFVVDDEIVVTDRSRRIVDVIPAGPRTHYARSSSSTVSGGGGSVAALDLSPDEIRVVQRVLIERGMLSGEADGVLGTDTRNALMTFQRQEGFQATGSIDTRTVTALGVSNQISATQGQSTTVGQGGNNQSTPQSTTGQSTGQSNAPAQQNQTTGQAPQNQPSTTGQAQQNQPANPGQASTQPPSGQTTGQAPAQSNTQSTSQPGTSQNTPTGQTNQNNAPPPSTSGQPAKKY
ncbi:peptidoglycan-binding protein [Bradyrhizobium sp. SEMIA]|nr:peptidoglycan-binding protein [Bradyrhizobium sp. SEMIA]